MHAAAAHSPLPKHSAAACSRNDVLINARYKHVVLQAIVASYAELDSPFTETKSTAPYRSIVGSINYHLYGGRAFVGEIFDTQLLLSRSEIDSSFTRERINSKRARTTEYNSR